jgi:hypothetical protein
MAASWVLRSFIVGVSCLAALAVVPGSAGQPAAEKPSGSVHDHMEDAGRAFRRLGRQIADPAQNASSLDHIQSVQEHLIAAKRFVPGDWEELPEADRAEMTKAFRKDLGSTIILLIDVEQALLDGDNAGAAAALEKAKQAQDAGHDTFRVEDEEEEGEDAEGGR